MSMGEDEIIETVKNTIVSIIREKYGLSPSQKRKIRIAMVIVIAAYLALLVWDILAN